MSDAYEVPTCQKCGVEYSLREGAEPSTYCDECAHVKVDELERELAQLQSKLAEAESRIVYLSKWTDRNAAGERIASLEAELKTERENGVTLRYLLTNLRALVKGECPSLLREDSGGDVRLDLAIDDALGGSHE